MIFLSAGLDAEGVRARKSGVTSMLPCRDAPLPIGLARLTKMRRHDLAATVVAAIGDKCFDVIHRDPRLVIRDSRRAAQKVGVHLHHTVAALDLFLDACIVEDGHHSVYLNCRLFHNLRTDSLRKSRFPIIL